MTEVAFVEYVPIPEVGDLVHYIAYGTPGGEFPAGVRRAAIITQVYKPGDLESDVGLCVLNPNGMYFNDRVPFKDSPGGWQHKPYPPFPEEETQSS